MIRLLLEPVNLLILDEPTNHLDMPSKDVLKEAIKAFDGTAIIVSHDRDFLDGLVSKVYEFGEGRVREHLGGIYDYLRAHHAESIHEALGEGQTSGSASAVVAQQPTVTVPKQVVSDENTGSKLSYQEHKEQQKKIRKAQRAVEEAEKKIASLEARIKELDDLLMDPKNASNMELVNEYTATQAALDRENNQWMELSEALESLG